jgi:serine/threonine protein kinase/WD40 repeat protein
MTRDHNLLFGVFAVQLGKVTPMQLMDAAAAWAADQSRDIASRLVALNLLSEPDRQLLQRFVDEAVAAHGGDVQRTLASFGGEEQVHRTYRGSIVLTADGQVSIPPTQPTPTDGRIDPDGVEDVSKVKGVFETPGRYTELREYARGGMGRVLLVHDDSLGREIALKELLPHLGEVEHQSTLDKDADPGGMHPSPVRFSAHILARFLQEARITGQLEHPGIVPVYELGHRRDGTLYYTMKLVRGRSLSKAIKECKNLEERLRLLPHFVDLCQAIAYAHSRGIIHRDIKPANVMVGEFGETVVLDWGLAKKKDREDVHETEIAETILAMNLGDEVAAAKTAYGQIMGTPVYMAPEQARGDLAEVDEQSDVYALGVVLYEILTGKVPFEGKSTRDILKRVIAGDLTPVGAVEEKAPPELVAITSKALRKEKASRYADAKSLATEVQRFQNGTLVSAYAYSTRERIALFFRRHKAVAVTAAAALFLIFATASLSYLRVVHERDTAILARQEADSAREQERRALARVTLETAKAEQELYYASISLADRLVKENRFEEARGQLENAPADKRHWEWGWLDRETSQEVAVLGSVGQSMTDVSVCGNRVAAFVSGTGTKVWNSDTADEILDLKEAHSPVLSPDGTRLLYTRNLDNFTQIAEVVDATTGKNLGVVKGRVDGFDEVVSSLDGTRIAAWGQNVPLHVLDSESGRVLWYHVDDTEFRVTCADFLPDGMTLVVGGMVPSSRVAPSNMSQTRVGSGWSSHTPTVTPADTIGAIRSLRLTDGKVLKSISDWATPVYGIFTSFDGSVLAIHNYDGTVQFLRPDSLVTAPEFPSDVQRVFLCQPSADRKHLAALGGDNTWSLIDLVDGTVVSGGASDPSRVPVPMNHGTSRDERPIVFSPALDRIGYCSSDGLSTSLNLYNFPSGERVKSVEVFRFEEPGLRMVPAISPAFSDDGRFLGFGTAKSGSAYGWVLDIDTNTVLETFEPQDQRSPGSRNRRWSAPIFSPDNSVAVFPSSDGLLYRADMNTGKAERLSYGHFGEVYGLFQSNRSNCFLSLADDAQLHAGAFLDNGAIWTATPNATYSDGEGPTGYREYWETYAFSPDDKLLFCWKSEMNGIWLYVFDSQSLVTLGTLAVPQDVYDPRNKIDQIAVSADGQSLAFSSGSGRAVYLWDAAFPASLSEIQVQSEINSTNSSLYDFALSRTGEWLAYSTVDNKIRIVETDGGQTIQTLPSSSTCHNVAFSSTADDFAAVGEDSLSVWNSDWEVVSETSLEHPVDIAIWSDDLSRAMVGEPDHAIAMYNLRSGIRLSRFRGHIDKFEYLHYADSKRRIFSASADGTLRFWTAKGQDENVLSTGGLATRPSESGQFARQIKGGLEIWRFGDSHPFQTLSIPEGIAISADFSPDGTMAVAVLTTGVKAWKIPTAERIRWVPNKHGAAQGAWVTDEGQVTILQASGRVESFKAGADEPTEFGTDNLGIHEVMPSPNGNLVALRTEADTLLVVELSTGKELSHIGSITRPVKTLSWNNTGNSLFATLDVCDEHGSWRQSEARQLRIDEKGQVAESLFPEFTSYRWCLSADHSILATYGSNELVFLDTASQKVTRKMSCPNLNSPTLNLSPDNTRMALTQSSGDRVLLLDCELGQELSSTYRGSAVLGLAFTPDGQRLAVLFEDGLVSLKEASSGKELLTASISIPKFDLHGAESWEAGRPNSVYFSEDSLSLCMLTRSYVMTLSSHPWMESSNAMTGIAVPKALALEAGTALPVIQRSESKKGSESRHEVLFRVLSGDPDYELWLRPGEHIARVNGMSFDVAALLPETANSYLGDSRKIVVELEGDAGTTLVHLTPEGLGIAPALEEKLFNSDHQSVEIPVCIPPFTLQLEEAGENGYLESAINTLLTSAYKDTLQSLGYYGSRGFSLDFIDGNEMERVQTSGVGLTLQTTCSIGKTKGHLQFVLKGNADAEFLHQFDLEFTNLEDFERLAEEVIFEISAWHTQARGTVVEVSDAGIRIDLGKNSRVYRGMPLAIRWLPGTEDSLLAGDVVVSAYRYVRVEKMSDDFCIALPTDDDVLIYSSQIEPGMTVYTW